ncbi:hypothetical protein [Streptomyces sp. SAS_270]|uniref:hypothetical protein n=1 Tax=Streptomyces sp. SAS_270 TaxID=3412748 RepID=UPI00403D1FE5
MVSTATALALTMLLSCARGGAADGDAKAMREALQPLHASGTFRMAGELRTPEGTRIRFDARLNGQGDCTGLMGKAESVLRGKRVWTRWDDAALDEAVSGLSGGSATPADPAASQSDDTEFAATKLLRGSYMVTDLPNNNIFAEGIAPACQAGELLANAGYASGDVTSGPAEEGTDEQLRVLTRVTGPVTVRVYVLMEGEPELRRAEYVVDGGQAVSAQFSEIGKPVKVSPPANSSTVSVADVLSVLG